VRCKNDKSLSKYSSNASIIIYFSFACTLYHLAAPTFDFKPLDYGRLIPFPRDFKSKEIAKNWRHICLIVREPSTLHQMWCVASFTLTGEGY
jgi:hypothetical protein